MAARLRRAEAALRLVSLSHAVGSLGASQEADAAEMQKKVQGANEAAALEARHRRQAERRASELQQQLVDLFSALGIERQEVAALSTERDALRQQVVEPPADHTNVLCGLCSKLKYT